MLFTSRRRVNARRRSNVWHQGDKLENLQARLAIEVGKDLAGDIRRGMFEYAAAVKVENDKLAAKRQAEAPRTAAAPTEAPPAP